jgi:hypothetical protein
MISDTITNRIYNRAVETEALIAVDSALENYRNGLKSRFGKNA